jgi:hypothetical protein
MSVKACSDRAGTWHGCSSNLSVVIWAPTVRPRSPTRVPTVRGTGGRGFRGERVPLTVCTTGRWRRGSEQRVRLLTLPAPPTRVQICSSTVHGLVVLWHLRAHSESSSDSHWGLGQRMHTRAHAATMASELELTTANGLSCLRACLVKSSSTCGQCMLGTGAHDQGDDQLDLLDMIVVCVWKHSNSSSPSAVQLATTGEDTSDPSHALWLQKATAPPPASGQPARPSPGSSA